MVMASIKRNKTNLDDERISFIKNDDDDDDPVDGMMVDDAAAATAAEAIDDVFVTAILDRQKLLFTASNDL